MKTGVEKLLTCTVSYVLSLSVCLHKYLVCIQGNYKEGTYYEDRIVWWQKKYLCFIYQSKIVSQDALLFCFDFHIWFHIKYKLSLKCYSPGPHTRCIKIRLLFGKYAV